MGWASGGQLFIETWQAAREGIPEEKRVAAAKRMITSFEERDWDTQDEAEGIWPEVDQALRELHPAWYEDDDDE
jgi:hypothetical protein